MTLAGEKELNHAFEETASIAAEFSGDEPENIDIPLAEMFGIDHLALVDFLSRYVDDVVHGMMVAMQQGKLPQETAVLGRQMMAAMVRGMAMGVVLERARGAELERLVKTVVAEDLFTLHEYDSHRCVACCATNRSRLEDHHEGCLYVRLIELVGVRG